MLKSVLLSFLLAIHLPGNVNGVGEEKYISCVEIRNYCSAHGSALQNVAPDDTDPHPVFRPGKAGVKGQKGDTGPPGPITEFDHGGFEERIFTKLKEMITHCRVFFESSCFYLVGNPGDRYGKDVLQRKCADSGGRLANLYSEEHRLIVSRYVRIELGVYAEIALGMTYNVETNRFRLTSGEWVDIEFTWHPSYPNKNTNMQNMFFSVHPDHASTSQGAFNHKTTLSEPYGLCEYEINV